MRLLACDSRRPLCLVPVRGRNYVKVEKPAWVCFVFYFPDWAFFGLLVFWISFGQALPGGGTILFSWARDLAPYTTVVVLPICIIDLCTAILLLSPRAMKSVGGRASRLHGGLRSSPSLRSSLRT